MPRNFDNATLVYVAIKHGAGTLNYGFNSRLKDSLRDNFGQVVITSTTPVTKLVIRANRPKPARASKRTALGYESSFAASDKISALKADGYTITKPKIAGMRGGEFSDPYYVTMNGIKIAFLSNAAGSANSTAAQFPDAFGCNSVSASDVDDLVWGADFPQPPVWAVEMEDGSIFSSIADPTQENSLIELAYKNTKPRLDTLAKFLGI